MSAVDVQISPLDVLVVVGVGVAAYALYRGLRGAGNLVSQASTAVGQAVEQAKAEVTQAWNNATSAPAERTQRWYLYGDEAYTGIDPVTGASAIDGARASDEFRRYEAQFRAGEAALGLPRSSTSTEGAAFGIYPRP